MHKIKKGGGKMICLKKGLELDKHPTITKKR